MAALPGSGCTGGRLGRYGSRRIAGLSGRTHGGGIAALRDTNGDGKADSVRYSGAVSGTGIAIYGGYLYLPRMTGYCAFRCRRLACGNPQSIVSGFPKQREHATKSLAFCPDDALYDGIGAPSNACQRPDRIEHLSGLDSCPLLAMHGEIWRFKAGATGQTVKVCQR